MNGLVLVSTSEYYSDWGEVRELLKPFRMVSPVDTIGGSAVLVFQGDFDARSTASASASILANQLLMDSQLPKALQLSNYAIQVSPQSAFGHFVHACILARLGERSAAIGELGYARDLALNEKPGTLSPQEIDVISKVQEELAAQN